MTALLMLANLTYTTVSITFYVQAKYHNPKINHLQVSLLYVDLKLVLTYIQEIYAVASTVILYFIIQHGYTDLYTRIHPHLSYFLVICFSLACMCSCFLVMNKMGFSFDASGQLNIPIGYVFLRSRGFPKSFDVPFPYHYP